MLPGTTPEKLDLIISSLESSSQQNIAPPASN